MSEVFLEGGDVEALQLGDAVVDDVPAEDFFVDVGELDAAGELGEVCVFFDEGFRIEDDRLIEVLLGNLVEDGAKEFGFDFVL